MNKTTTCLNLYVSKQFFKSYKNACAVLQNSVEGNIHDLINLYRSDLRTLSNRYDKLAHCKNRILEGDIGGGHRFLFNYFENRIVLLDLGNHEVVPRYNDHKYKNDLSNLEEAPGKFFPERQSKFFLRCPDKTAFRTYQEELSPEWLYFLENEQATIFERVWDKLFINDYAAFIIGGPGTGKTCILLKLLKDFADSEYKVGISISDSLTRFIEDTIGADISKYRVDLNETPSLDILFVDDPTRRELHQALALKKSNNVKAMVAAFDPLQLDESITDKEFNTLKYKVEVHKLNQCYRQKENIGKNTRRVIEMIAASSPYLSETKIQDFHNSRKSLTSLANDLEFINPNGYIEVYEDATVSDIETEVNRIMNSKDLMWRHSQGLLVLLDNCELSKEANAVFKKLSRINYVKTLSLDEAIDVKGLEFQHVFIFINKTLFDEIHNGFKGTGTRVYEKRRLLRIPFSRAKDSLVTFALD